jgi:putative flippase GtrA
MRRWLKFNFVGLMGASVQITVLWITSHLLGTSYLTATIVAVEAAIIHNFLWHVLWTFSDRRSFWNGAEQAPTGNVCLRNVARSFMRFQITTGAVSILGNSAMMLMFAGYLGMNLLVANCLAIAICSTANFFSADRFSFRHKDYAEF